MKIEKKELKEDKDKAENLDDLLFSEITAKTVKANSTPDPLRLGIYKAFSENEASEEHLKISNW